MPKLLHGWQLTTALLIAEQAVTLVAERLMKRREQDASEVLVWKPLEGHPVHWRTSASLKLGYRLRAYA